MAKTLSYIKCWRAFQVSPSILSLPTIVPLYVFPPAWFPCATLVNVNGLFNVATWGVLPSLSSQRHVINALDDTDFGRKVDFCGGRKTGEPGENPSESDWDQPISAHVRAQDRTRVAVVGGEDDDHCINLTPPKCRVLPTPSCLDLKTCSQRVATSRSFRAEYTNPVYRDAPSNWYQQAKF